VRPPVILGLTLLTFRAFVFALLAGTLSSLAGAEDAASLVDAGAKVPQAAPPPGRFTHFAIEHGLSQNTVRAVLQDRSGFLWLASEEGLNRFDGYSFVVFRNDPARPNSLPNDMVTALLEPHSADEASAYFESIRGA